VKRGRGRGSTRGGEEVGEEIAEEAEEEVVEDADEESSEDEVSTGVVGGRGEFDREFALIVPFRSIPIDCRRCSSKGGG